MEYSGNTNTINDPISSLLNPNPTFFNFPHDHDHPTTFTSFQNQDVYLNSQPPETSRKPEHHHPVGVSTKNPKKRTRASRRPPTTVLTTDTTNFRQMVQEFTGIPTTPFTRRLDVFGSGGLMYPVPVRPVVQNITQLPHDQQSFDVNGTVQKQTLLLGSQNPMFSFQKQTLLGSAESDKQQLDVSCSSIVNDQTDKGNNLEM